VASIPENLVNISFGRSRDS